MTAPASADTLDYSRMDTGDPTPFGVLSTRGLERETTLGALAQRALTLGAGLAHHRLGAGDRVLLVLPTGTDYLTTLLACLMRGVVPCTVAVPSTPDDPGSGGMRHLGAACSVVRPRAILAADTSGLVGVFTSVRTLELSDMLGCGALDPGGLVPARPESLHHIQLTSGSTSAPKAVALTHRAVAANIDALVAASQPDADRDRITSWLPLYHDMGLLQVLTSLTRSIPLDVMSPVTYLRDPLSWLRAITQRRCTVTAAPPFGFRGALDRYRRRPESGIDLSTLRFAFVGAEPIQKEVLEEFRTVFAPLGLSDSVLVPCYGMAETVLATTLAIETDPASGDPRGVVRTLRLDRDLLDRGKAVPAQAGQPVTELVSCGAPVPGMRVRVVDDQGSDVTDGTVGALHVAGSSVMAGYLNGTDVTAPPDGWHDTGDLGFLWQGRVYVVGRFKEMLVVRGRNIPPYDVEAVIESHSTVENGRSAVFSVPDPRHATEAVIAVVEQRVRSPQDAERLRAELTRSVRQVFGFGPDEVQFVSRGALPRTSSGKRQRSQLRTNYLHGGSGSGSPTT